MGRLMVMFLELGEQTPPAETKKYIQFGSTGFLWSPAKGKAAS